MNANCWHVLSNFIYWISKIVGLSIYCRAHQILLNFYFATARGSKCTYDCIICIFIFLDNPLNCDCSLLYFANWLSNHSSVYAASDTAVCATPPTLENGLLKDLPISRLVCGGEDNVPPPEGPLAMLQSYSSMKISLRSYQFDGSRISLGWLVTAPVVSYYCKALVLYEHVDNHEVLLDSKPVRCNSSQLPDAKSLTLSLSTNELQPTHSYRSVVSRI